MGNGLSDTHHVFHVQQQLTPQGSAGMRPREILFREAACLEYGDRQGIAHRKRRGRARSRREIVRTGLFSNADVDRHARGAAQSRIGLPDEHDQRHAEAFEVGQQEHQLGRLTGVRDREQHVGARDHAEVTVTRFGRVHEECRGAGAGQRGCDLAGNVARFADSGDDHTALAGETHAACRHELGIEPHLQQLHRPGLDFKRAARGREQQGIVDLAVGGGLHCLHYRRDRGHSWLPGAAARLT